MDTGTTSKCHEISFLSKSQSIIGQPRKQFEESIQTWCQEFGNRVGKVKTSFIKWENVVSILEHLNVLQEMVKLCNVDSASFAANTIVNSITSPTVWEDIMVLTICSEELLVYVAGKTVAISLTSFFQLESFHPYAKKLADALFKWILEVHLDSVKLTGGIKMLTTVIREFKIEEETIAFPSTLLDELKECLPLILQTLGKVENIYHVLKFIQVLLESTDDSELTLQLQQKYDQLLNSFALVSSKPYYRYIYYKILGDLLPLDEDSFSELSIATSKAYINMLQTNEQILQKLIEHRPTCDGFAGTLDRNWKSNSNVVDGFSKVERMLIVGGVLRAAHVVSCNLGNNLISAAGIIISLLVSDGLSESLESADTLLDLLFEQDDALVEMMLLILLINIHLQRASSEFEIFLCHPHHLFVGVLERLCFDTSVLLDWLTSNETKFLLYFLKYLKYIASSFAEFKTICNIVDQETFPSILSAFIQLKTTIEKLCAKNLFPYSVKPLIKNINTVLRLAEA
ncbi:unnamed protein product [Clavelina lepadiformis]|uniref:Protein Lines N-terminal domain-containing protein n=1 Tax=Clavelina lepadiformis TaxID=159417 RepID=A0ABP0FDW0_CLALP